MEQITWGLTIVALGVWLGLGWSLARRPLPYPSSWGAWPRRAFWLVLWLAALVGGSSGPRLWDGTREDLQRTASAQNPAETVVRELRTPVAVERVVQTLDHEGRPMSTERYLALRIPVGLLGFFALVGALSTHARAGRLREGGAKLVASLLLAALFGCAGEEPEATPEGRPVARVFVEGRWDTLAHVRQELSDTLLLGAGPTATDEEGFWVLDGIAKRVVRFDWEGRIRWLSGREGQGPGEFVTMQQAVPDEVGRLWVLDPGNARISALDADGEVVHELRIGDSTSQLPHAFAVRSDGSRFHAMLWSPDFQAIELDDRGAVVEVGDPIPVPRSDGGMTLQGVVGQDRVSGDWIYAHSMGDGMYRMRGTELVEERMPFVEAVPFPRLVRQVTREGPVTNTSTRIERPSFAAADIVVEAGTILVRFRGESEEAGRLVDRYDLESGVYRDSILLPRAGRMSAWEDRFVLTANDPTPEVLVLRWNARG